jgi:hypothetical protein
MPVPALAQEPRRKATLTQGAATGDGADEDDNGEGNAKYGSDRDGRRIASAVT